MSAMRCAELREVAPEVALGLLTGEERAAALAHLERCEACRAEVASLAGTADEVLLAAPEAQPPPGFADRVLAGLAAERVGGSGLPAGPAPSAASARAAGASVGSPRPAGRRRGRRLSLAALAAAAVAIVVAGLVTVLGPGSPQSSTVAVADMRTGRGDVVGEAILRGGDAALVVVDVPAWDALLEKWGDTGSYWLTVEQDDGTRTLQPLPPGDEDWTVQVDAPAADVASVSMLDDEGRVWCTGRFELQG